MARGSRQAWPDVDILVVDDHRVFGEALAMRLEAEPGVRRVWVADDLGSARATLPLLGDGLVLLDYQLGDVCGLEMMDDIARLEPRPTVVVLSGVNDPDAIVAGVHAGVDAWMLKAEGYGALVEVAVDARDHVMTLPRRSLRQVIQRLMTQHPAVAAPPSFLDEISPREMDVLRLLVVGLSRDEIAARLFVSPHTVRTHVQHLHQRAHVSSNVALVARAREAGLPR